MCAAVYGLKLPLQAVQLARYRALRGIWLEFPKPQAFIVACENCAHGISDPAPHDS